MSTPPGQPSLAAPAGGDFRRKVAAAVGASTLVLVVGALSFFMLRSYRQAQDWVEHTGRVQLTLAGVASGVGQAEGAARGYLLTRKADYLGQYARAREGATRSLVEARRLTRDNALQQQRLDTLATLVGARFDTLDARVAVRDRDGLEAAAAATARGMGIVQMILMRDLVARLTEEEARLLEARRDVAERRVRSTLVAIVLGSLVAALLSLITLRGITREVRAREQVTMLALQQREEIAARAHQVEEQAVELEHQLEEQQALTEELAQTNDELHAAQEAMDRTLTGLRRSEERFRSLVWASAQIVWTAEANGAFEGDQADWREFTGQRPDQYRGAGWLDAVHPDDRAMTHAAWEEAVASHALYEIEHRLRRHDGAWRRMSARGVPIVDERGAVREWVGVHADVTEQRESEAEIRRLLEEREGQVRALAAANAGLEAFSYSVSHDLRSPLSAMSGLSHVLEEDYGDRMDDAGRHLLVRIRANAAHMAELIDGLLELARVTRAEMKHERVDLSELARSIGADLARQFPDHPVRLDIEPDLVAVGDRRLLAVLLQNLLANAWKYTGKTPAPYVELARAPLPDGAPAQAVAFRVRDNGAGFDMAYAERLFAAFQRLHEAREFEGTGIGLAIVQRIVTRHGGRIWAEASVNQGATFYFTLQPDGRAPS